MGIPYFKTADGFPCPDNPEALLKAKNGELLFYDMTPAKCWTSQDINRLLKGRLDVNSSHFEKWRMEDIQFIYFLPTVIPIFFSFNIRC